MRRRLRPNGWGTASLRRCLRPCGWAPRRCGGALGLSVGAPRLGGGAIDQAPMCAALATGTIVAPAVAVHAPAALAVAATPATLAAPVATAIAAPLVTWQRQWHPRSQQRLCRAQLRRMQRMPPAPLEPSHDLCGASGMRNRSSACYRLSADVHRAVEDLDAAGAEWSVRNYDHQPLLRRLQPLAQFYGITAGSGEDKVQILRRQRGRGVGAVRKCAVTAARYSSRRGTSTRSIYHR